MATAWPVEALGAQADRLSGAAALAAERETPSPDAPRPALTCQQELDALRRALEARSTFVVASAPGRADWEAAAPMQGVPGLDDRPLSRQAWRELLEGWALPLLGATLRAEAAQLSAFWKAYARLAPPAGRFSLWVLEEGVRLMACSSQPWLRADGGALALALMKSLGDTMMKKLDPHDPRRPAQQKCRQATIAQYGRPGEAEGTMDALCLRRAVGTRRPAGETAAATRLLASALANGVECSWETALAVAEGTCKQRRRAASALGSAGFAEAESTMATAVFAARNASARRAQLRAALRALRGWARSIFAAACLEESEELREEALALRERATHPVSRRVRERMHASERKDWCAFLNETPPPGEHRPRTGARLQVRLGWPAGEELPEELRPFVSQGQRLELQRDKLWTLARLARCLHPRERLCLRAACARSRTRTLRVGPRQPSGTGKTQVHRQLLAVAEDSAPPRGEEESGAPLLPARLVTPWLDALVQSWSGDTALLLVAGRSLRWRPAARAPQGLIRACRAEPPLTVSAPLPDWSAAETIPLAQTGAGAGERVRCGEHVLQLCGPVRGDLSLCRARDLSPLASGAPSWHEARRLGQRCDCVAPGCACPATEYWEPAAGPASQRRDWRRESAPLLLADCALLRPGATWSSHAEVHTRGDGLLRLVRRPDGSDERQHFDSPAAMVLHDLAAELLSQQWTAHKLLRVLAVAPTTISSKEARAAHGALRVLEQELFVLTPGPVSRLCALHDTQALLQFWQGEQTALRAPASRKRPRELEEPPMPPAVLALLDETPCPRAGCTGTLGWRDDYNRRSADEAEAEVSFCRVCGWRSG